MRKASFALLQLNGIALLSQARLVSRTIADFLPWAETAVLPDDPPDDLPICRDLADLDFMRLAQAAKVDALASGDGELLALRDDFCPPIVTAEELRRRLDDEGLTKT